MLEKIYTLPSDPEREIEAFTAHYHHRRYHESVDNLTPADVYFGRGKTILIEKAAVPKTLTTDTLGSYPIDAAQQWP